MAGWRWAFGVRRSAFGVRCSALGLWRWESGSDMPDESDRKPQRRTPKAQRQRPHAERRRLGLRGGEGALAGNRDRHRVANAGGIAVARIAEQSLAVEDLDAAVAGVEYLLAAHLSQGERQCLSPRADE